MTIWSLFDLEETKVDNLVLKIFFENKTSTQNLKITPQTNLDEERKHFPHSSEHFDSRFLP